MMFKRKYVFFCMAIWVSIGVYVKAEIPRQTKDIGFKKLFTLKGHLDLVQTLKILQNETLASGSADTTLRIWDMDGTCIKKLYNSGGWINKVEELPDGRILCGSNGGGVTIWDAHNGNYFSLLNLKKEAYYGNSVIQLKNGNLAFSTWRHTIKFWDIAKDICTKTINTGLHIAWISSLIELQNSNYLATSSWDSTVKIWDISQANGCCVRTLIGHTDCVNEVVQVSDKKLASAADDKTIRIWDIDCNESKAVLSGHNDRIYALIVVNKKLISGSRDKTVKIWNPESNQCLLTIPCNDKIHSLAFLPQKQYLFVGLGCGDIEVFSLVLNA